jgi:hypothetical protein
MTHGYCMHRVCHVKWVFFSVFTQLVFTEGQVLMEVDFQLQRIHNYRH